MKCHFIFHGRKYLSDSKYNAWGFVQFWGEGNPNIFKLDTTWDIKGIERAPGWVPERVDFEDRIEYAKE